MFDKTIPKSGWHTVTGTLSRNMINEMLWEGVQQEGNIVVDAKLEKCYIGFYEIGVKPKGSYYSERKFYTFAGITEKGNRLNEKECRKIMALPTLQCKPRGILNGGKYAKQESKPHIVDSLVETNSFFDKAMKELSDESAVAIEEAVIWAEEEKAVLKLDAETIELKIKEIEKTKNIKKAEEIKQKKQINTLTKELKQKQQSVFMEELKVDVAKEKKIKEIKYGINLNLEVRRLFLLKAEGK
jgi:hypothetical protein